VTLSNLPSTVYVGLAVTSHNSGTATTGTFQDVSIPTELYARRYLYDGWNMVGRHGYGRAGRRRLDAVFDLQDFVQLLRPPRAVQPPLGEDQRLHRLVRALREVMRPVAARLQALQTLGGVALQVFVPGLAADAKLLAQIGDRESTTAREHHKARYLFHLGYVFPRHRGRMCNPSLRILFRVIDYSELGGAKWRRLRGHRGAIGTGPARNNFLVYGLLI
jgi:hypothetical protein